MTNGLALKYSAVARELATKVLRDHRGAEPLARGGYKLYRYGAVLSLCALLAWLPAMAEVTDAE